MYTKEVYPNLFGDGVWWTDYYKNGELIATRSHGKVELHRVRGAAYAPLTRAKAYRYWDKHFPDRCCWSLPELLQDALDMEPASYGYFIDRRTGELCGYEG